MRNCIEFRFFFFLHLRLLEHFLCMFAAYVQKEWRLIYDFLDLLPVFVQGFARYIWKVMWSNNGTLKYTLYISIFCTFTAERSSKWLLREVKIYQKFCDVNSFGYKHVAVWVWPALVALTVVFSVMFFVVWDEGPDETVWLDVKLAVVLWAGGLRDVPSVPLAVCAGMEGVGGVWEVDETLSGGTADVFWCVGVDVWMEVPVDKVVGFVAVTGPLVDCALVRSASKDGPWKKRREYQTNGSK